MQPLSCVVGDTYYHGIDIKFDISFSNIDGLASISLGNLHYMAFTREGSNLYPQLLNTEECYSHLHKKNKAMLAWVLEVLSEQFDLLVDSFKKEFCQGKNLL